MLKHKYFLFIALPLVLGVFFALLSHAPQASAFDWPNYTNYLIDDSVFRNSNTMSASDIQNFLNSEGSGLASFSDTEDCTSGPRYSSFTSYFLQLLRLKCPLQSVILLKGRLK